MANERFISLDAVIKKLKDEIQNCKPVEVFDDYITEYKKRVLPKLLQDVINYLEKQPTVDAVEVVHGHWEMIPDDYFDLVEMKCSVCGESWGFEEYEDCIPQNYHYCPNCGAKMDGDGNA